MKIAIVVNTELNDKTINQIKNILSSKKEVDIFSNKKLPSTLGSLPTYPFEPDLDKKKEINYETMSQLLLFENKLIGSKTIAVKFQIENASIWNYQKFRIYFLYRNNAYDTEILSTISNKYEKVHLFDGGNYNRQNPGLHDNIISYPSTPRASTTKINIYSGLKYTLFFFIRTLIGSIQFIKSKHKKHIVIDHSQKQYCIDIKTQLPKLNNYYLCYLFDKLDSDFAILDDADIVNLNDKKSFNISQHRFFRKSSTQHLFGEYVLFRGLISKEVRQSYQVIKNQYYAVVKDISKANLTADEKLIFSYFTSITKTTKYFLFKYTAYKFLFKKLNIKTISTIDENSPRIKTILDAAKNSLIKTIGIQHGNIHDLHPAYLYSSNDHLNKITSDYTLIWGEEWKKFLMTKGNYPETSLIITGQIRTDIIPLLNQQKREVSHIKVISDHKKNIMFASQPQRDSKLRYRAAYDVFMAIKELPSMHLTLKLHPAEKNDAYYYQKIAKELGCENYSIVSTVDLYKTISQSDLVITCFSTVGAECVYFRKPLIILDHLKQDIQSYYKDGIAFQATDASSLKMIIQDFFNKKIKLDENKYSEYVKRFAYKIDGKTSDRVLNFIKNG